VEPHTEVEIPPYDGTLDLEYARPAGQDEERTVDSDI
jgi:hypothetical protein